MLLPNYVYNFPKGYYSSFCFLSMKPTFIRNIEVYTFSQRTAHCSNQLQWCSINLSLVESTQCILTINHLNIKDIPYTIRSVFIYLLIKSKTCIIYRDKFNQ